MDYAKWLERRVEEQNAHVWLLNTGWTGGPYGIGERFSLQWTRAFVTAILDGSLADAEYVEHPVFGLYIPTSAPNVPAEVLDPRTTWADGEAYDSMASELAQRFRTNDQKYDMTDTVRAAGPNAT
jgi:phosphoenolpyruvate carboxykinase (ATP)